MSDPRTHPHVLMSERPGKCCAITRTKNSACPYRINSSSGRGYFCGTHKDLATPDEVVCEGSKVRDGPKCNRRAFGPDYPFCMPQHDMRVNYCDPNKFRQEGLRKEMLKTLRKRDGEDDRYNIGRKTSDGDEVDHIGECQVAAMCCQFGGLQVDEERDQVVEFFRDELVNKLANLLETLKATNRGKGHATTHFQQDLMKYSLSQYDCLDPRALDDVRAASPGNRIVATFDDRLIEQKLLRASTKAIRREMGKALRSWQYKCLDHGESPRYQVLGEVMGKIFPAFDLYTGTDLD